MGNFNSSKNDKSRLSFSIEPSKFNPEFDYEIITSDELVKKINAIFKSVTSDHMGGKFVPNFIPPNLTQYDGLFNSVNNFINDKASDDKEKNTMLAISAKINSTLKGIMLNANKPSAEFSYIDLYFEDRREEENKIKFIASKAKVAEKTGGTLVDGLINAYKSRGDFRSLALTDDAKDFLKKLVPNFNPMDGRPIKVNKNIIWENLYKEETTQHLWTQVNNNRLYTYIRVPIDISKCLSMIYGSKIEGTDSHYEYKIAFVVPDKENLPKWNKEVETNNYMLHIIRIDGEQMNKANNRYSTSITTNKLGFLV